MTYDEYVKFAPEKYKVNIIHQNTKWACGIIVCPCEMYRPGYAYENMCIYGCGVVFSDKVIEKRANINRCLQDFR